MSNPILSDNNLKKFIEDLRLPEEQKNFLIAEIGQMDEQERFELLNKLKDVALLNIEEDRAIEKVKKNLE